MKNQTKPNFVIISAELSTLSWMDNYLRSIDLISDLRALKLSYKSLKGCYKGREENSFLVIYNNESEFKTLLGLSSHYGQECILDADHFRKCHLVYNNGRRESIGYLTKTSEDHAKSLDAYSYDKSTDTYYIVR